METTSKTTAVDTELNMDAVDTSTDTNVVTQPTEVELSSEASEISLLTGQPYFGVLQGMGANLSSVRNGVDDNVQDPVSVALQDGMTNGAPIEETAEVIMDTQAKKAKTFGQAHAKRMESYVTVGDKNYNQFTANYARNTVIMQDVISEKLEGVAGDTGFLGHVGDFLDYHFVRYLPVGMVEALMRKDETEGQKFFDVMVNGTDEEAQAYADDMMTRAANEGFFTDENYQAIRRRADQFEALGHSAWHDADQVLAVVEAVPLLGQVSKAIGTGAKATRAVAAVATGTSKITKAKSLAGPKVADDLAENASKSGLKDVDPDVQDDLVPNPQSFKKDNYNTGPTQAKVDARVRENKIVDDVKYRYKVNAMNRVGDDAALEVLVATKIKEFKAAAFNPVASYNVVDLTGLDNRALSIKLGKVKTGDPYKTQAAATKVADKYVANGVAARAVPVDTLDEAKGFYIEALENIDTRQAVNAIDLAETSDNVVTKLLGSTRAAVSSYGNTLANMSESARGALRDAVDPDLRLLNNLPQDSKTALDKVMRNLRDGSDAGRRQYYNEQEFAKVFERMHPKKSAPTEKDLEAYYNMIDANDAAYKLKASELMRAKSQQGYKTFSVDGETVVGRRARGEVGDDEIVLMGRSGQTVSRKDLPEDVAVFEMADELEGGIKYFSEPADVRMLQPEDVLGYNAGGPRINPDANFFVTSGTGRGRALLTAFSEKQAREATQQMGEIFEAMRTGDKTTIDKVIQANNDWDPSIEDMDDMVNLMNSKGWNADEVVGYKARDSVVQSDNEFYSGMSAMDVASVQQHRYDDVLMEYGGADANQMSAVQAVYDQLETVSQAVNFRAYNDTMKTSVLKRAGVDVPEGADVNMLFKELDVTDNSLMGRKLRAEIAVINRREGVKDQLGQTMDDFGKSAQGYVFDKTGVKLSGRNSPTDLLLATGFRSAFGFLNVSQFFLQASHAATITAISPRAGLRSLQDSIGFRIVMNSGDRAAKQEGYKRLAAKHPFMTAKDFEEAEVYLRTDGRANIQNDSILSGTGAGWGINTWKGKDYSMRTAANTLATTTKYLKKADEVGLTFFNKGEQVARNQGRMTAIYEYKMRNPKGSIISKEARAWISRREQDLTFNMTTASRGAWQSGLMKVPTQWLSYAMRSAENVVVGRGFTAGERARMGTVLAAMGGTAGLGLTGAGYAMADWLGVEEDSPALAGIQYGVVDAFMSYGLTAATGENVRTAFGSRLGVGTAFFDVYDNVTEGKFSEVALGPSGNIVGGAANALGALVINMDSEASQRHLATVLRTPSGVNNAVKAWQIWDAGQTTSKTGRVQPFDYNNVEGALALAGINDFKSVNWYGTTNAIYKKKTKFFNEVKSLTKDYEYATQVLMPKDPEKAFEILHEVGAKIDAMPYPPSYKLKARRQIFRRDSNDVLKTFVDAQQLGMKLQAKTIVNTTE